MNSFVFGLQRPALVLASCGVFAVCSWAAAQTSPSISPPKVSEPVAPKASNAPAIELTPAPAWSEGQPVRVMPDLKQPPNPASKTPESTRKRRVTSHRDCPDAAGPHSKK